MSAAAAEVRDFDLLTLSRLPGEEVHIENVTDARGVLVVSGPRSRELLQSLTPADLSNAAFPYLRAREIEIAGQALLALRVSYVGELGWELHAPMSALPGLYEAICSAGRPLGISDYGLYAVNSMRIEKGYKAWGSELTNELTLPEADMDRFIRFEKPDFVGKQATQAHAAGPYRIAYVEVDAATSWMCAVVSRCWSGTPASALPHRELSAIVSAKAWRSWRWPRRTLPPALNLTFFYRRNGAAPTVLGAAGVRSGQ